MSDAMRGRAVVVTGGGTGIGRAVARQYAAEGAEVLVAGRTGERLAETATGTAIRTVVADIAAADGPAAIVTAAVREFGRIDVLVNNAAIIRPAALGEIDRVEARQQLDTNLLGPLLLAQEALPYLADGATIVNVTSNPAFRGWPRNSVYGATKVALDFLTRTWALELAGRGVRVLSVAPGITATPVMAHAGFTPEQVAESREGILGRIPLGRIAEPDEVAWWIVAVTRAEAGYATGQVIHVDGGLSVT